jgi:predicted enzyme related to lactoylglutathione lyase
MKLAANLAAAAAVRSPVAADRGSRFGLHDRSAGTLVARTEQEAGMNFNNILIGSENPEALVAYYTKLFGEPGFNEGGYAGWKLGSGYVSIGPHSEVHGKNAHPGRLIWNLETSDVRGEFEKLKAAGAIVIREPYEMEEAPGYSIATLADPDDNYFQLATPYEMASEAAG